MPKPKLDIPVPHIEPVASYRRDVSPDYELPRSYVRYHRPSQEEWQKTLEYVADKEDETWLAANTKFGGAVAEKPAALAAPAGTLPDPLSVRRQQITLGMMELMLDLLEKATAFEAIITFHQAEKLILAKIPQLYQMFPHKARQGVTTTKTVLHDVYNYWMQKRSKLKRPLLRRFWPVTSTDDTNPHLVFRPREKEKYKLRKKRQNDMDAYIKMKQLRTDFDNLRVVLDLVKRREELSRIHLHVQVDLFQQRLFDLVNSSGRSRLSKVAKDDLKRALDIPIYFDQQTGGRRVKRLRSAGSDRPMPTMTGLGGPSAFRDKSGSSEGGPQAALAGRNNGEPAPLFVHPLRTRETYSSSWESAVPHVPTFVNSHPEPTFRYRQRPRVGRGGRVCIDRIPLAPGDSSIIMPTVYTAGRGMQQSLEPKAQLMDLLPAPLDHQTLSRKIEMISVSAIKDDVEGRAASAAAGEAEENDGDEVVVKLDDWLQTDDQLWGEERFAVGPI